MVQSLGISVGNANSYVAACQGGGIEILLNEYSNRSTPSMVAFTDQVRAIGVDASSNLFMNIKNTIFDLMVLLGKPYKELNVQGDQTSSPYPFKLEEGSNGEPLVVVTYLGEARKFTITQVLAMLFTKLRSIADNAVHCVISCPQFFNDSQKSALVEASLTAGLNPMQIISDMSAIVLNYTYYRTTKEDTDKFIAFINMGQSNLQCVIAWLNPKEDTVKILAEESELVGGRDFDKVLAAHFVEKNNLSLTLKSYMKLVASCEKLKKLLSSNSNEIPINVESLISDDKDFTDRIERATFENLSQDLLQRVEACFKRTFENAKVALEKDESLPKESNFDQLTVELVGGSTRIPAIKQLVQRVFNIAPSTTLNTDEAVARGCVLHCATLHPGMKVKRQVVVLGSGIFYEPPNKSCDQELRRVELELICNDKKHKSRTEARNSLEEFIYSARSTLTAEDPLLEHLNETLDWLFSDEGDSATEGEYMDRIADLQKRRTAAQPPVVEEPKPEPEAQPQPIPVEVEETKPEPQPVEVEENKPVSQP